MTNKQLVALGVRLFCIWLAVYILRGVLSLWMLSHEAMHDPQATAGLIFYAVILIATLVALWLFPLRVARKLLPHSAQETPVALPPAAQLQSVGFCLLGLWLLTQAVPGLAYQTVIFHWYTRPGSTLELGPRDYAALAERLVELALAIWLMFGARGLLGLIREARTLGSSSARNSVSDNEEDPPAQQG